MPDAAPIYRVMEEAARHSCWDASDFDGTMQAGCPGCDEAEAHPCEFCGYGHVFPTHNPEPHYEGGDFLAPNELSITAEWTDSPHIYYTADDDDTAEAPA